ncbi:DUF2326 domain-containing protein [Spiroplasma endosymbiont of Danaus chrysippus]|uniref:DUF2326 domain-containing protein n=1 Tax=Spiroplasma endosymbiont of Danaus chrysippus TaxID=2691041 RepID=UPI00157AB9E4|nr:DUF2326 domain-containing protein [Spiroplasma endosymbiont of Danaus chrysippus]
MGLDLKLVRLKKELNDKKDNFKNALKQFEDPEIKKTLVDENADAKIEIDALKRKLELFEKQLKNFKLAENLSELKQKLYNKRLELQDILNLIFIYNKKINLINEALNQNIEIQLNDIKELYGEVLTIFPKNSIRNLTEVENFHKKIIENRITKLKNDKNEIEQQLIFKKSYKNKIEKEIDEIYNFMNNRGDLIEYNTIISQMTSVKEKITKFKRNKLSIDEQISINNSKAQEYLDSIQDYIKKLNTYFTKIINNFYPEEYVGGITIDVNSNKNNQLQFSIEPKINYDSSTGITNAKIMCFDTLILILNQVNIKFLIHDSNIFHGVDINKFSNFLKYLNILKNYQFIFTINQNDINELKLNLSDEEYKKIITNNIILELNGKGEDGYLIGEKIDLELDKD